MGFYFGFDFFNFLAATPAAQRIALFATNNSRALELAAYGLYLLKKTRCLTLLETWRLE